MGMSSKPKESYFHEGSVSEGRQVPIQWAIRHGTRRAGNDREAGPPVVVAAAVEEYEWLVRAGIVCDVDESPSFLNSRNSTTPRKEE